MITNLLCSSMDHVSDRATAFLFCDPPYTVVGVRPNGVILERPAGNGASCATVLFVKLAGKS